MFRKGLSQRAVCSARLAACVPNAKRGDCICNCVKAELRFGILLSVGAACVLAGCAARESAKPPTQAMLFPANHEFVDLQSSWRIRVVTPIFKSGKFIADEQDLQKNRVGSDFVGYEVAFYSVRARPGGGVSIRFSTAETVKNGKTVRESQPIVSLFDFPPELRFVRLIFLMRVSKADHNEGILAASSREELDQLTRGVEDDPTQTCEARSNAACFWIPAGIVAQPEKRDPTHRKEWVATW